jgi:two-component system sensor histidine kinase KdpD
MNTDHRPDPDLLLQQIRNEARAAERGKLRIYFGANAGVGKTFAMLQAAQRERAAGGDVVIGLVETHGRAETLALIDGLEVLPLQTLSYRGRELRELDLDAILARRPAIVLVDELAHSNVDGARHPKRWQDVQELLDAGIDVWSALNVQHLESLNGAVGMITGVRVHETVPDTLFNQADEIVLVDVTPDELLQRLRAGKVYRAQQADRAVNNFFRKGNLIALREMALRRAAEHVEGDVRNWRIEQDRSGQAGLPAWPTSGALLACIGPSAGAEQTVRAAVRLASQMNVGWYVAYVETPSLRQLPQPRRDRVLAVMKLAAELGASTSVLTGSDVAEELVAHASSLNCATVVLGRPDSQGWRAWLARRLASQSLAARIANQAPGLDLMVVGERQRTRHLNLARFNADEGGDEARWLRGWGTEPRGYAWALASCVLTVALATPLLALLDLANIAMLFQLVVALVALRYGRGAAALSAVINVAAFDFFFVPPRFSFAVSDAQYLVTFVVMLAVGLIIGQMTAGLRFQARVAAGRELRMQILFELARDLSAALESAQVASLGEAAVQRTFHGPVCVMLADLQDQLQMPDPLPPGLDITIADWVLRNGQPAGLATATLSSSPWHYVPLRAPMRLRGVMALKPAQTRWLMIPEQQQQLDTLARQIAIALERVHYVEVAQQALVDMESERLRNTLLAGISHDVRTPLTALMGLADTLRESRPALSGPQLELASQLGGQARQLYALVTNLLDMARLQSGGVQLRMGWQSVEEIVGSSIRAAAPVLHGLAVQTDIPRDLPLVEFDAVLMERVLVNLLENAARHGAPPIRVWARVDADGLSLGVSDQGPGLPAGAGPEGQALFETFTRGHAESAVPGVGLGLALCKIIVLAHKGRIGASSPPSGGAEFKLWLPRRTPPPELVEPEWL